MMVAGAAARARCSPHGARERVQPAGEARPALKRHRVNRATSKEATIHLHTKHLSEQATHHSAQVRLYGPDTRSLSFDATQSPPKGAPPQDTRAWASDYPHVCLLSTTISQDTPIDTPANCQPAFTSRPSLSSPL